METQYGQTTGSFIRNANYPLEADYIFRSIEDLKEWEERNRKYLHEGLLKVVVLEDKQILYWYYNDTFEPLLESTSLKNLTYILADFEAHGTLRDIFNSKLKALQQELDQTQVGVGLNGDGSFDQLNMRDTKYLQDVQSVIRALKVLDEEIAKSDIEGRVITVVVDQLPEIGDESIIYIVGNVLYRWNGEEYEPMGTLVSTREGNQLLVEDNELYYNTEIDFNQGYIIQNVNGEEYKRLALFDQILVTPVVSASWKVKTQAGVQKSTSTSNSLTVETGAKVDLSSTFKWTHSDTTKDPRACSGSYGTTLPASGQNSAVLSKTDITSNSTFTVTLSAPKQGLMVSGTSVVAASGNDTKAASCSVAFHHRRYYGVTTNVTPVESDVKALSTNNLASGRGQTVSGVTTTSSQYYCYAYPKSLGALSTIIQDGAEPVLGAFNQREINITNEYGAILPYYVYTSNNPGAFTRASLQFS